MSSPRLLGAIAVAFLVGAAVDVLIGYSPVPGYGAGIGLFGCLLIVVVSKWLGKAGVQQPEDYYPDDLPADLQADREEGAGG